MNNEQVQKVKKYEICFKTAHNNTNLKLSVLAV